MNDRRSYDAWGAVRAQQSAGDPKLRYCASLGHRQDDESGLVYMRARYYEPGSGRFISQDPVMDGFNWYVYCGNNPVDKADPDGRVYIDIGGYWFRWDHPYSQEGTGELIQDLTWGITKGGQRQALGSVRPDGSAKHGEMINDSVRKIVGKSKSSDAKGLLGKAARGGGYGLAAYAVVCSLDGAFLSDPAGFADVIGYVGGDWDLLQGYARVGSD